MTFPTFPLSVPFFPDTERPGIPTQWIEMVQTSVKPESPYSPPATTASTTVQPSTVMAIFDGLNQTDYTQGNTLGLSDTSHPFRADARSELTSLFLA